MNQAESLAPQTKLASRRPRFSLRIFLLLIAVAAAGLAIGQALFTRHPAHSVPSYEKAPYTSSHQMKVGPNTIRIESIARNRHDGKIHLMSGDGLSQKVPNPKQLNGCEKWLDVVQFEITPGPELVEIIEVRVFDHETRSLLGHGYGWQVVAPNLIQVYGLGKEVPEQLDLWLRLHSHADDIVYTLPPKAGASTKIPGGTVAVREVKDGYTGWSAKDGFLPGDSGGTGDSAVLFDWEGDWPAETDYQLVTVSDVGEKDYADQFMRLSEEHTWMLPQTSPIPITSIDHYELRPFGGRHRFFFDGLKVPPPIGRKFDPPPKAVIKTNQGECQGVLTEFDPLVVRYQVEKGSNINGSTSNGVFARILRDESNKKIDQKFSVIFNVKGTAALPLKTLVQDNQGLWGTKLEVGSYSAGTASSYVMAKVYQVPLEEVTAIEVTAEQP